MGDKPDKYIQLSGLKADRFSKDYNLMQKEIDINKLLLLTVKGSLLFNRV